MQKTIAKRERAPVFNNCTFHVDCHVHTDNSVHNVTTNNNDVKSYNQCNEPTSPRSAVEKASRAVGSLGETAARSAERGASRPSK